MSRLSGESVELQMKELLKSVTKEIDDAIDVALKEPPKLCKTIARDNAPKNTGEYRSGFKIKRHRRPKSAIVYNDKAPGLTHLLEHGHVIRNQSGTYGRAPAHHHLQQAEEQSVDLFVRTLDEQLDKILD